MFQIVYLAFNLFSYALIFVFIFPLWENLYEVYMVVATCLLSIMFWLISGCMNPGIVTKHPAYDLLVSRYLYV